MAGLLGLDVLELADQYAPVGEARGVDYDEGRALVDAAFEGFSPRVREIAEAFFTDQRVDAEPRAGKRGGAFCAPVAQDAKPYVLLNYTDTMNDVLTIAHEFGHGMHFQLSHAAQTPHSAHTGLALAERAVLRRQHAAAGRLQAGLVVHPPLNLHPLLHVRLCVCEAGGSGALWHLAGPGRGFRPGLSGLPRGGRVGRSRGPAGTP